MMHARRTVVAVVALCTLFVSVWMLPDATASEEAREPAKRLTEMAIGASRVDWQPTADYERLVLTVAGPGDLFIRREVGAGEAPSFSSNDVQGGRLPDGVYAYELRAISRLPEAPLVQSGHLWVQEGSFVTKAPARPGSSIESKSTSKPPSSITANTTVPDDLIVQGHACIGSDCVDAAGPALKIKDFSNYTLQFDGLGCCFPWERKWALQANEPGSSGDFLIRDVTQGTIPFRIGSGVPDNALTILFNGNVGLGTLTPAVRLDVKASATGQAAARLQNSSATGYSGTEYLDNAGNVDLFFGVDNAASTTRLNSVNNNPIVILTNGTERMRITSGGNVGIGTANPGGARLQVGSGEVRFPPGAGAAGFTHFNWEGDGRNYIRGTTLIADNGGSVGIGTASPSSRLHVNGGDIRVSGGSFIDDGVTLNAPDYVFEPSYSLMPLAELREFVSREKHLPNVPAAADIKKEGLNLGQFQMRLLEKIEELALYTLQQEEQIREQQESVQSLRDENLELKARLEALEKAQASGEPK